MAQHRPFPPSTRRSALARAAGLHAASPILVGAIACAAAVIAMVALGRAVAARLGGWVVAACESPARIASAPDALPATPGATDASLPLDLAALPRAVLELALPLLAAAALAAIVAHLIQTRAVWMPRRRLQGAPAPEPHRARRAILELGAAIALGAVAFGWLWLMAPRLAAAIQSPLAGAALIASLAAAIAIAWVGLGIGDALVRHAELAGALQMSHADKREDDRLAGADPRWRARRDEIAREHRAGAGPKRRARSARAGATAGASTDTTSGLGAGSLEVHAGDVATAIAGSSVLLLGDGVAVAVAWDPVHRPVPVCTAIGRGTHATQLLALARRHAIAVHRDPELAAALATVTGPIAETTWPRLAEIIAATRGRHRSI